MLTLRCILIRIFHAISYLGVADGVGGWRTYGVDPGRFSRALVRNCERLVHTGRFKPDQPELLIAQSYEDVLTSKDPVMGTLNKIIYASQGLRLFSLVDEFVVNHFKVTRISS